MLKKIYMGMTRITGMVCVQYVYVKLCKYIHTVHTVETGNELYNTGVRQRLILFSKDIGAF
jgi:hypothetical protein